jgi:hypothetical protein
VDNDLAPILPTRDRLWRSADPVNLVTLFESGRIRAPDRNHVAILIDRDPR